MRAKRQLTVLAWLLFLVYVAVLLKLVLFKHRRHIAAIAFGASLLLELVQLLTGLGSFDVDDLLLNVLGGVLGVLTLRGARRWLRRQPVTERGTKT